MKRRSLASADLNRSATIEWLREVPNNAGGQVHVWEPIATDPEVFVNATPVGGRESLVAGTLHAVQPWRVEMRWRGDVSPANRLAGDWLPDGWRLTIDSAADPDGRRGWLVIFGTAAQAFDLAQPVEL